jgi:hypothetical protein
MKPLTRHCRDCGKTATAEDARKQYWINFEGAGGWRCLECAQAAFRRAQSDPEVRALQQAEEDLQDHLEGGGSLQ